MNSIYNSYFFNEFYDENGGGNYMDRDRWMPVFSNVADRIIERFNPKTLLDAGCATGYLVEALRNKGVEAYGYDISEYAISRVSEDIKPFCIVHSITEPLPDSFPKRFDMVVSIEVLEHLYPEEGRKAVFNLCQYSNQIIFTSTPDDRDDATHVNVQPREYWVRIFAENLFYRDLIQPLDFICPWAMLFNKKSDVAKVIGDYEINLRILNSRMVTDVHSRDQQIIRLSNKLSEKEEQIIRLNSKLSEKEEQIENLNKASEFKDSKITELNIQIEKLQEKFCIMEENLNFCEEETLQYQETIAKQGERIQEFIRASQWLHDEIDRWQNSYNAINNSTLWKLTKPIRLLVNVIKKVIHHIIHNFFTQSVKKTVYSIKKNGIRKTIIKIQQKLNGKLTPNVNPQISATCLEETDVKTVDGFLNQRLRNCQPIPTIVLKKGPKRLNFVTDSIEAHSLLGGVATALVVATEFASRYNLPLRIITRTTPVNPLDYKNIMTLMGVSLLCDVSYYSDYNRDIMGNCIYKLDISDQDIFFATSWWSAAAIQKTTLRKRFFYIIQEVETYFYPHGDEHYLCSKIMQNENIDFIINSHYLYDYFKTNAPVVANNGIYFEPAFPQNLYQPKQFSQKEKYNLFFYSRPNNPRNMFIYGIHILNECIKRGILNTREWNIYYAGQSIPELKFCNGYIGINLGLIPWNEYGQFLSTVDLSLSLMYTPHPSYPPFDVASSGGVVVSNKCHNKEIFNWCDNVILSDLDEESFINAMERGIALAKNVISRRENFENSTIPRKWQDTINETINFMGDKI